MFRVYHVEEMISQSRFSTNDLLLAPIQRIRIPALSLLDLDKNMLTEGASTTQAMNNGRSKAIQALVDVLSTSAASLDCMNQSFSRESSAFLADRVLSKLCKCIMLDVLSYKEMLKAKRDDGYISANNITCEKIAMGAANPWYGTPDARCQGFIDDSETVLIDVSPLTSPSTSEEESDGTSTVCEAKLASIDTESVLSQLVKTTVTSAFIEHTQHLCHNPMVPVILVNTGNARICLYDASQDLLLISENFPWLDGVTLCKSGTTLLWAMLNHR